MIRRYHKRVRLFRPLLTLLCLAPLFAADFELAGHRIPPGSRLDFALPVPAGADPATEIPVTVFHGVKPGRTLLITAGIHGAEFVPILAVQRFLPQVNPQTLAGTLLVVPVAHPSAFFRASVFYNPYDQKNLARVFPGSPQGTQTERIAHVFTTQLLRRAEGLIELHAGDATESLHPFVGVYGGQLAERQYPFAKQIGLALGLPTVVRYRMDTPQQIQGSGRSPNRQAVADGVATVLVEIGDRGRRDERLVAMLSDGLVNLLRVLGMQPGRGRAEPAGLQWYTQTASLSPKTTGIFYPLKEAGQPVRQGEKVGYVTDFKGQVLEELISPTSGLILYLPSAPPLNAGPSSPLVVAIPGQPE